MKDIDKVLNSIFFLQLFWFFAFLFVFLELEIKHAKFLDIGCRSEFVKLFGIDFVQSAHVVSELIQKSFFFFFVLFCFWTMNLFSPDYGFVNKIILPGNGRKYSGRSSKGLLWLQNSQGHYFPNHFVRKASKTVILYAHGNGGSLGDFKSIVTFYATW